MTERRIFLSTDECAAIRAGRKTQFRRAVKLKPWQGIELRDDGQPWPWMDDGERGLDYWLPCPFGKPGDRLWVPESWAYHAQAMSAANDAAGPFVYRADGDGQAKLCDRWRAPVSMPRFAARIVLEVVSVRVERLRDIAISDAICEGYDGPIDTPIDPSIEWFSQRCGQELWDANPWVWVVEFRRVDCPSASVG